MAIPINQSLAAHGTRSFHTTQMIPKEIPEEATLLTYSLIVLREDEQLDE